MKINIFKLIILCFICLQRISAQTYCGLVYDYDAAGNRIERTITGGCTPVGGDTRFLLVDSPATVVGDTSRLTCSLFPNPTAGMVSIVFNNAVDNAQITVTDNVGRQLYATSSAGSSIPLNLSNFAQGVYYIRVKSGGTTFQSSIIKN